MIGSVRPANPAPPQFRTEPARAPVARVPRSLDLLAAPPHRQVTDLRQAGRIDLRV